MHRSSAHPASSKAGIRVQIQVSKPQPLKFNDMVAVSAQDHRRCSAAPPFWRADLAFRWDPCRWPQRPQIDVLTSFITCCSSTYLLGLVDTRSYEYSDRCASRIYSLLSTVCDFINRTNCCLFGHRQAYRKNARIRPALREKTSARGYKDKQRPFIDT
jgi:hypothetical protein